MTVVYVENVFLLNWITDYLLLLTTARLAGAPLQRRRLAVCAALGGVYAVAVFVPGFQFLGHAIGKAAAGIGMTLLAYWPFRRPWRLMALFFCSAEPWPAWCWAFHWLPAPPGRCWGISTIPR